MKYLLPIADGPTVRRYALRLSRKYPAKLWVAVALHILAAMAGLVAPWLMGDLVQQVSTGTTMSSVDKIVAAIAVFLLAQTVLTRYARYLSFALGETVLADLREDFVKQALALPVSTVERAGTGDLLTRTSRDIEALGWSVRFAVPETIIALVTTVFTIGACVLVGAWVLVPMLVALPVLGGAARWYLRRAKAGYLRESASYAAINASVAETAEGARTVEALGLEQRRLDRIDADIAESFAAERYTLSLRTVFFPAAEIGYLLPTVATLLLGGWLHSQGRTSRSARSRPRRCTSKRSSTRSTGCSRGWTSCRSAARRWPDCSESRRSRTTASPADASRSTSTSRPRTCVSPTPTGTCCTASTCTSRPASGSPWSDRPAPGSRRSAGCSPASTHRASAASRWATCG